MLISWKNKQMPMRFDISIQVNRLTGTILDAELAKGHEEKHFSFGATLKRCDTHLPNKCPMLLVFMNAPKETNFEVKQC
jgi:hypothetical protein